MAPITISLTIAGLLGLISSLRPLWQIAHQDSTHSLSWYSLIGLVLCFIAGYAAFIATMLLQDLGLIQLILAMIFFGGGLFVAIVSQLCKTTMQTLEQASTDLEDKTGHIDYRDNHDRLTELANRRRMARYLDEVLTSDANTELALFTIDINGFKDINDTFGYDNGDAVLRVLAYRLKGLLKDCDLASRITADEFMVALRHCTAERARQFTQTLLERLGQRVNLYESIDVPINLSVGIALAPDHARYRESLIRRSDIALQGAKQGGESWLFYRPGEEEAHLSRLSLMTELRQAVDDQALVLHFQPKMSLQTQEIIGVEALVRWRHPTQGMIPPDDFIPLAERSGSINALTEWVIDAGIKQLGEWLQQGLSLDMSINISARDLGNRQFSDTLLKALSTYQVPAQSLVLEITENAFMDDRAHAVKQLNRLQHEGIRIAIDDFGTGYSSLSQLRDLPVNELKIDKSFIMKLASEPDNARIARSIVELGRNLGLSVTAEGVEDDTSCNLLIGYGCNTIQGFGLSRPMVADRLPQWLKEHAAEREDASLMLPTLRQKAHSQYQP